MKKQFVVFLENGTALYIRAFNVVKVGAVTFHIHADKFGVDTITVETDFDIEKIRELE